MKSEKEESMSELKSSLRILNQSDLDGKSGAHPGQTSKELVGNDERPSERLLVNLNVIQTGAYAPLHWHPVEGVYYVISGSAGMRDIEGREYDIGPGTVIYTPPGISGSHEWYVVKERLQLVAIRATTNPMQLIQFKVDRTTKESSIELERLIRHGGLKFKSFY
jgi:mannose-6-phosphate isomerase-like protein (cupin superfamily)